MNTFAWMIFSIYHIGNLWSYYYTTVMNDKEKFASTAI